MRLILKMELFESLLMLPGVLAHLQVGLRDWVDGCLRV